ncbi:MAG TPA: Na+/H+ antiporter NhaA [Jatrophihabitans sp.]|nr:Na+/H+ antiporter NhaA [Jatrophihabitans sp.]
MSDPGAASRWRERTRWARGAAAPVRVFVRTESASAGLLAIAIVAALIWASVDVASYDKLWGTDLSIRLGNLTIRRDLRTWVNNGLMTFFFLVVGLEARREIDLGELRDRRRFLLPLVVGLLGMLLPALIYLAVTAGHAGSNGWGTAISTDTALAMGVLALVGRGFPDQMRAFLLTVFVVDDIAALVVIAAAYSEHVDVMPALVALAALVALVGVQLAGFAQAPVLAVLGVIMWAALMVSGIDPVVAGLAVGLSAAAYTPARGELEQATGLFRLFREQPTPELARSASAGLRGALSPNARLQHRYHPWTSYVIVPLFGLANAGIHIDGAFLTHAYTAPVTLGVLLAYVFGKPVGIVGGTWLVGRLTHGRVRPAVGWASVLGGGTIAGIGFTVSLLIATLALHGTQLADVKLGVLSAALVSALLTAGVLRATALLSPVRKARALLGDEAGLIDLVDPVDPERDHIRGPADASVTLVEYGDFECPYCGRAEPAVREVLADADIRFVWRHLPLPDVHPRAELAAEAAEAAAAQGQFWAMHDLLLRRQHALRLNDLLAYADKLGLDRERFRDDLNRSAYAARVAQDVESADLSGVAGTPTFFVNGQRHYGAYDPESLTTAVRVARARARIAPAVEA